MKHTPGIFFGAAPVIIIVALAAWIPARSEPSHAPMAPAPSAILSSEVALEPAPIEPTPSAEELAAAAHRAALKSYVLDAMTKWAPANTMPKKDIAHYDGIADDIVSVVLDSSEAPLWPWDKTKARTAILVATIGFFEGRYWKHVDDGKCNDSKWRKSKDGINTMGVTGNCDGGYAWSIFQVHPEFGGILLTSNGEWTHATRRPAGSVSEKPIVGTDMIANRQVAVRVALHFLRKSLHVSGGGLCGYTGETEAGCPKARVRLGFAQDWSRKHPFSE